MFSAGQGPGRVVASVPAPVPVVPGKVEDCAACGAGNRNGVLRTRQAVDGVEMMLCLDYFACAERYRGGGSPAEFAELLSVAS